MRRLMYHKDLYRNMCNSPRRRPSSQLARRCNPLKASLIPHQSAPHTHLSVPLPTTRCPRGSISSILEEPQFQMVLTPSSCFHEAITGLSLCLLVRPGVILSIVGYQEQEQSVLSKISVPLTTQTIRIPGDKNFEYLPDYNLRLKRIAKWRYRQ
jgi:hypothetical protein